MIGRLKGQVVDRTSTTLVLDVHDVGYRVHVSPQCRATVGERVELFIHTHVREDMIALYGFSDAFEQEVFDLLITVPSIGPVKAMAILASPALTLVDTVLEKNPVKLAKLPGVGKKTAERMVVDLYDKMLALRPNAPAGGLAPPPPIVRGTVVDDLVSALVNLGFRPAVAEEAATHAVKRLGEQAGLQPLLKDALLHASGSR